MDIGLVKEYLRVDYDDDDTIIEIMMEATLEHLTELIPDFDRTKPTARQKVLIFASVKDLYDNREKWEGKTQDMRAAIHSLLLREILK